MEEVSQKGKGKRKDLSKLREETIVVSQDPSSAKKINKERRESFPLARRHVLWFCRIKKYVYHKRWSNVEERVTGVFLRLENCAGTKRNL